MAAECRVRVDVPDMYWEFQAAGPATVIRDDKMAVMMLMSNFAIVVKQSM